MRAMQFSLFQSTLPARGATGVTTTQEMLESISIHAPRTGSDTLEGNSTPSKIISIHAPRTGSDEDLQSGQSSADNFNPRSPHGERLSSAP